MKQHLLIPLICFFSACIFPSAAFCAPSETDQQLQQARQLYSHENYEEALELLKSLRASDPQSSEIAFYLGMTYKRMQDYASARPFLEDACRLKPRYDGAVAELIELLYQIERLDEANEWIATAEREFIAPVQVAFLKGLVLLKQDKPDAAIKAFNDAQALDPSLAPSVAYQKGIALSRKKNYAGAKEQLRGVVVKDPTSDLAAFANEYIETLRRQQDADRRLKANVSYALQYDDNVAYNPTDSSLLTDITDKHDWLQVLTAQTEWAIQPARADGWGLNAVYSFYGSRHNDIGLYDMQSHDLSLQPAWYREAVTFALPVHYNYVTLSDDPYLDAFGGSMVFDLSPCPDRMWQMQGQYNRNDYHWAVSSASDNMDSDEYTLSVGHYWFRDTTGYLNLRYDSIYHNARGANWDYNGNRLSFISVVPLFAAIQWNFVADYLREDFRNVNTNSAVKRTDDVYTVSNLLVKDLTGNLQLTLQHTFVYDRCKIGIYEYKKNTYSVGVKYRF